MKPGNYGKRCLRKDAPTRCIWMARVEHCVTWVATLVVGGRMTGKARQRAGQLMSLRGFLGGHKGGCDRPNHGGAPAPRWTFVLRGSFTKGLTITPAMCRWEQECLTVETLFSHKFTILCLIQNKRAGFASAEEGTFTLCYPDYLAVYITGNCVF